MSVVRSPRGSSTSTSTRARGNIVKLEEGIDKEYLCAHICAASKAPKIGKTGDRLFQETMTAAIWKQEDAAHSIWAYKMEVGYRMTDNPPSPIMSPKAPNRPSRFPLGRIRAEVKGSTKDLFRIPDCIILKVTDAQIKSMITKGYVDWSKFIPVQENIKKVVEVKFRNDFLSRNQIESYKIISGPNKFRELRDTDCNCQSKRQPEAQPRVVYNYKKIINLTYKPILRPVTPVMTPRYPLSHIFGRSSHSPPSGHAPLNALPADEFLAVAKVVVVVGCVVVVGIVVAAEAPVAAVGASTIWLYGYAN